MYQYFIVTVTLAIVSSILFAHYLDKKSMTKKAVVFCSISVAILSSFFPIISGAILDMTTRINEILHINLWTGFSYTVIFIVYLGGILILSVYLSTIVIGENDESDENNQNPISYIFMLMHKLFSRIGHPALKPATNESAPIENSRTNNYHVPVLQETVGVGQIMLQKPVDSDKNIDTIGIGTIDINGENTGTQDGEFKENEITDQVNEEPDAEFEVIEQTDIVEEEIETSEATDQTDSIEEEIEVQESVIEESEITEQEEETIEATTESDIDQLEVIEDIGEDISIEEELEVLEVCEVESGIAEQTDIIEEEIETSEVADQINSIEEEIEVQEPENIEESEITEQEEETIEAATESDIDQLEVIEDIGEDISIEEELEVLEVLEACEVESEIAEQTDIVEEIETSEVAEQTNIIEEEIEVQEPVIEENEITEQEEETIEATTESDIDQLEVIEDIGEDISIEEEPETCEAESEIAEQADSLFDHISDEINADTINEVDRLIEHAFMLKASGDLEGAIVNYMYALEHDIDDQVVFWLVLDICVLYKQLGKPDLAKDILESYVANYGSIMNDDVKAQIICNL